MAWFGFRKFTEYGPRSTQPNQPVRPHPKKTSPRSTFRRKPICHGSGVGREWPVHTGKPPEGGKLEDGKPPGGKLPGGKPGAGVDGEGWIVTPPPPHLWVEGLGTRATPHPSGGGSPSVTQPWALGWKPGAWKPGAVNPKAGAPGAGFQAGAPLLNDPPAAEGGGVEYPLGTGRREGGVGTSVSLFAWARPSPWQPHTRSGTLGGEVCSDRDRVVAAPWATRTRQNTLRAREHVGTKDANGKC